MFKRTVIQKTSGIKETIKVSLLGSVCEQPVFKGLSHFLFSKYSSIALRISSATFNPVSIARFFSCLICLSVRYVSIRFMFLIYTLFICMSRTILKEDADSSAT